MKRCIPILLALLLLAGCEREEPAPTATPTPTPSPAPNELETVESPTPTSVATHEPVGAEVDIGDGEHTFWVEVVDTGEPWADSNKLLILIYQDETKEKLFQTFESWWADPYGLFCFPVEDMDFDGDMDFSVCNIDYRSFHSCSHYIWDEEQEKFVEDPYGLNDLNNPCFDEEKQVIRSNSRGWRGESTTYYQYLKGSLACIRFLDYDYSDDKHIMRLEVKDELDGVLTVVYEEEIPFGDLPEGKLWTEEFERWFDLDYHG